MHFPTPAATSPIVATCWTEVSSECLLYKDKYGGARHTLIIRVGGLPGRGSQPTLLTVRSQSDINLAQVTALHVLSEGDIDIQLGCAQELHDVGDDVGDVGPRTTHQLGEDGALLGFALVLGARLHLQRTDPTLNA